MPRWGLLQLRCYFDSAPCLLLCAAWLLSQRWAALSVAWFGDLQFTPMCALTARQRTQGALDLYLRDGISNSLS